MAVMAGWARRCLAPVIAVCLIALSPADLQTAGNDVRVPNYIGSKVCAGCHRGAFDTWKTSDHALAWQVPTDQSVLGDFNDVAFEHKGIATRFTRRNGEFIIGTPGQDGVQRDFPVVGVAGIAPLQQYLLETEPGRLQAFDVAWDVAARRWYHLYPDADLPPDDGLHWTGSYKTWNARCAECHATGFKKNYQSQEQRYQSREAEIGVGCEACHGPGEAHVAWANSGSAYEAAEWPGLSAKGFTIDFSRGASETEIQLCAGCHSLREPLFDGNPVPGTPYHDSYRLALLREGLYHADGSIEAEVYVYGSFLQSKMYARGVKCSDCHEPHAARLKAKGNVVCTQCHQPAGNPRFPTLPKQVYDAPSHHFHAPDSKGAACTSCHMVERVYMGIDGRRDHAFRVPRPDLSTETGAPNACTDCHADRSAAWAAAEIARRFPDSTHRGPHFSQVLAAARKEPAGSSDKLLDLAGQRSLPGIVRASALDLLRSFPDEQAAASAAPLLEDSDPLVRAAAIALQRGASPIRRVQLLTPLLRDPLRSVRIATAHQFLDVPAAGVPPAIAADIGRAMREWQNSLLARIDYPETHMVIGGTALVMRNRRAAEQAFHETVQLDPQMIEAWTMIVRLRAASGDLQGARTALDEALAVNPSDERLLALDRQLGGADSR
jgi:predicted CXXCH cytochrome family protein